MPQHLVIVESPAKARTIEKFLGKDYQVLASYGHVRALPSKQGSVNVTDGFQPNYQVLPESKKHLDAIKKALKQSDRLILATDPDREGEAISWHLVAALGLDKKSKLPIERVVFHEITKDAILHAIKHPRQIAADLVDAQQARSILDYLVGFTLSPFLWKKIRYGLSAGRVQSVALRLVCDREKEIQAFCEQEYWTIEALLASSDGSPFDATLTMVAGSRLDKFAIPDATRAEELRSAIAAGSAQVERVTSKQTKRTPPPPFTTSTLQQEASRKLGFSAKKTMATAQKLYEGVAIGDAGTVGLITYMRTDSVNLSQQALAEAHQVILGTYGQEYALAKPRHYRTKSKNAQEAHEAIRPTYLDKSPTELKRFLTPDQYRFYDLIWKRTIACQMAEARLDQTAVDITVRADGGPYTLRANGSVLTFPGYMKVYIEGVDDADEEREGLLPPLVEGTAVTLQKVRADQHSTQPPPRYTEATLVKTLEEYGIGRPSTYASTLNTLVERKYVRLEKRRFFPEDVGMVVNDLLTTHFTTYVDYNFTAGLEEQLDQVARGELKWQPLLADFWEPFITLLKQKEAEVSKDSLTTETIEELCPECGRPLAIKLGKRGKFIACTGFKEGCTYTRNLAEDGTIEEPVFSDETCTLCNKPMLVKQGRYGKYLACSGYPECKNIQPLEKPKGTGVPCPACAEGELTEKKSRYGKLFYSCNRYPDCKYALWDPPVPTPCPSCGHPVVVRKVYKRKGEFLKCPNEGCGWTSA